MKPWLFTFILLAACDTAGDRSAVPPCLDPEPLTEAEIEAIIAQAAARAEADGNAYVITVTNRDGVVVGSFGMAGADLGAEDSCRSKARTAAFLSSNQHAFNTRTARFIIQDNFPPTLGNTPGGPLYGVQFSSLACSDVVGEIGGTVNNNGNGLSGDFGSMPLFRDGCLIGAVAVDGGADDTDEERAAWAGSDGFRPATSIFGDGIFLDGIRLEFIEETPTDLESIPDFDDLVGAVLVDPADAPEDDVYPTGVFGGLTCEIRYPPIHSPSADPVKLMADDVIAILNAGAARSDRVRAAIRRPLGSAMRCFISVVDTDGVVLGCIRTPDATLFSFDVSIQKARTAAYFSSDDVAFTTRAAGFIAQGFFPPGLHGTQKGPLHGLQDAINPGCAPIALPLDNGITIFPGGVPLYKGGVLVGAIGISGDGVDQDDFIAMAGADLFPAPAGKKADELDEATLVAHLDGVLDSIAAAAVDPAIDAAVAASKARLAANKLRGQTMPYVKFPRQPFR
ncbi:MAG: GlcG/HbpS family heme-binding protein [Planctomycetota bacterium]